MKTSLEKHFSSLNFISRDDPSFENYCEDTMLRGVPSAIARVRSKDEIKELLAYCNGEKIPVTFSASQTSMTGASVAEGGLLISCEDLKGVVDIGSFNGERVVVVRPGTIVADLQKSVEEAGFFYPVAPTSRDECTIGGNVNTNASGEDSYKYGPVRKYIRWLKVIKANGEEVLLKRGEKEDPNNERNRAGYILNWKNPIDLFIASEGTLGFIFEIGLALLPNYPKFFSAMTFFKDEMTALKFIVDMATKTDPRLRALEFIDRTALKFMTEHPTFPKLSDDIKALVYFKVEQVDPRVPTSPRLRWADKPEDDRKVNPWNDKFKEATIFAATDKEKEEFRLWRHQVPEEVDKFTKRYQNEGGGKVGSDWWVPIDRLFEMMNYFYSTTKEAGLPHMAYAHLGSGHPHANILTKNPDEKKLAQALQLKHCQKAVELGGGVTGEHGIGKLYHQLLHIQHPQSVIDAMKSWKRDWDPNWILGRGNLFDSSPTKTYPHLR